MCEILLTVLSLIGIFLVLAQVHYYSQIKRLKGPKVLFEDETIVVSGQEVPIECLPKEGLSFKERELAPDTLISVVEVKNKSTGSIWKYHHELDREWYITVPETEIQLKGSIIRGLKYPRTKV